MSKAWQPTADVDSLVKRAELLDRTRAYFRDRDIVEVQTSTLDQYGVTDVAIENVEVPGFGYLQTSPEYQMKRLLAAGMPSCFQIGPAFRAGEVGRWHNTEFTMLEWYELGVTLDQLMANVAALTDYLVGSQPVVTKTVAELLNDTFKLDLHEQNEAHFIDTATEEGLRGIRDFTDALDFLVSSAVAKLDVERVFLTEYPSDQAALARTVRRDNVEVALRFEFVVNGLEIANGYDELRDVVEFRRRCDSDNIRRERLGLKPKPIDPNFEAAMANGLPECCGVAVGLDRLFAIAMGKPALSDVLAFATRVE
ncbi:MAG: EF-P lysine aminoacylase EpmA [Gammaproteobacteria bacterium]|nr:EF-P lysine aminoacylase EpmA [Gammaproteobacteria bacterium]